MSDGPRSVKIDPTERGGWSSERPRREGEPERPARKQDVSVRCRLLAPTDSIRYSPGSLLLVVGPGDEQRDTVVERLVNETGPLLTLSRLRALLRGKLPADQVEAKARELREATARRKLANGESVVISTTGLDPEEREHWVRLAAPHRRPRHLLLVEPGDVELGDEERTAIDALRKAVGSAALGEEGFATVMRLSGKAVAERRRIVFARPQED